LDHCELFGTGNGNYFQRLTTLFLLDRITVVSKKAAAKVIIIITDGTEQIQKIAGSICEVISRLNGETVYSVKILAAEEFAGNELLPADIFILGCEKPSPPSFTYLEELLLHINLVSRKSALFSINEKTVKYLLKIMKDCEAKSPPPLIAGDGEVSKSVIKNWLKGFI